MYFPPNHRAGSEKPQGSPSTPRAPRSIRAVRTPGPAHAARENSGDLIMTLEGLGQGTQPATRHNLQGESRQQKNLRSDPRSPQVRHALPSLPRFYPACWCADLKFLHRPDEVRWVGWRTGFVGESGRETVPGRSGQCPGTLRSFPMAISATELTDLLYPVVPAGARLRRGKRARVGSGVGARRAGHYSTPTPSRVLRPPTLMSDIGIESYDARRP